jgi:hypothetical protein
MSPIGTDRRLCNVGIDGSYQGKTGPDMLNARLSQDDPSATYAGLKSRSAAFSRVTVMCYRMAGSMEREPNSLVAPGKDAQEEAPCST